MSYTPFLISNFATGLDKRLQPWLIPDDAQEELLDGYVYRGTMSKREGYTYFATGEKGGVGYRESRIVDTTTDFAMVGAIDGVNTLYTLNGLPQIARGSAVITGNNPAQTFTDNSNGFFFDGITQIGTINYLTGVISITLPVAPAAGTVLITYNSMPGLPVMMIASFITASNIRELIVADTRNVNFYNTSLNVLENLPHPTPYTGDQFDFFTWVNYESATSIPRLLFSNNVDVIQQYDGAVVTDYTYNMLTGNPPIPVTTLTCAWMASYKDRLILLRTTENGAIFGKRIRISGTGVNTDNFITTATGAGFIDIPDATWIYGAAFNRDDLIIFTQQATWVLKFTGNDTTPFALNKIDESRGSEATFGAITYLNRTTTLSPRGLINTDGYRVVRQDEDIPDFSYNEIDGANFSLCFAGSVDADRDHYLLYPPPNRQHSLRILTTNYDEDNYSTYRLALSCMGNFVSSFDVTWSQLLRYGNWDQFAAEFGDWNSFAYTAGAPFSVGGGHKGEIWKLAVTEIEDNPVRVREVTIIDVNTLEVTTDWNNYRLNLDNSSLFDFEYADPDQEADIIYFTGLGGTVEANNKQYPIISVINNNVFRVRVPSTADFSNYTSGGTAQRVIPFSSLMKQFNPYIAQDQKVRCGWIYMYVNSTGTKLTKNYAIANITNSNPAIVTTALQHGLLTGSQVNFFGILGMTELNGAVAFVTVLSPTTYSLNDIDSSGFGAYISGGYAASAEPAKLVIEVLTNDRKTPNYTQLNNLSQQPYQGICSNLTFEDGVKKWYKVFINQTGKFIQFRFLNTQAGAKINIQATMPGFQPVGRLI